MTVSWLKHLARLPLSNRLDAFALQIATLAILIAVFSPLVAAAAGAQSKPLIATPPAPLPVDEAFPLSASFERGNIVLSVDVLPGHYLYQDRFEFNRDGEGVYSLNKFKQTADAKAKTKNDPHFGAVKVFESPVTLTVGHTARAKTKLTVIYQGCSELAGVCYPPTKRSFELTTGDTRVTPSDAVKPGLGALTKKNVSQ
jgi:thiol:disulfide interchange protein